MKEKSTEYVLDKILKSNNIDSISDFVNTDSSMSFHEYINKYLNENQNIKPATIIKDSGIEKSYASQILNGTRLRVSRDYVIAICYAARMNLDEVKHALRYSDNSDLYAKDGRDARLIFAFNQTKKDKRASVTELNILLTDRKLEPLKISKG